MRRVVLQMQMSVDGFIEAERDDLDWTVWNWAGPPTWDQPLIEAFNATVAAADTVLLSRPMVEGGYLDHWTAAAHTHRDDVDFRFARRVVSIDKVVVSRSNPVGSWPRTRTTSAPLAAAVGELTAGDGGDILVFGGVRFARALVRAGLVDEIQFYVNPTAVGAGERLLDAGTDLELLGSAAYDCGIVVNRYRPVLAS